MPISARYPDGRSQHFTILRRKLLQKAVPSTLLPPVPRTLPQHSKCLFSIGDQVAEYWIDEFDKQCVDYGEVCGICWHPYEKVWVYLINWTSGDTPNTSYPYFDEQLVIDSDLRRVSHV